MLYKWIGSSRYFSSVAKAVEDTQWCIAKSMQLIPGNTPTSAV